MIRRVRPALVLAVAGLTTAACGAGNAVPRPAPQVSAAPQPAPPVSAAPAGKVAGSRDIECVGTEAHVLVTMSPATDDLVVGSINWPGLRSWATANPKDFGDPATGDYKLGAEVRAGATVTVSIPIDHARTAGLEYGQGWQYSPTSAVTFHACANSDTAYIGGFRMTGRGCVPLDIAEGGRPATRVMVSFFAGAC